MSAFLKKETIGLNDFAACLREQNRYAHSDATFSSVLLSAIEFDSFCDLMIDVKKGKDVIFCPPLVDVDSFQSITTADEKLSAFNIAEAKQAKSYTEKSNNGSKEYKYFSAAK